jgi:hypothetical protein
MGNIPRSVAGSFFLDLDGVKCGLLKSVDGGGITAEVISEPTGPGGVVKKHIGPPKYEEFELRIGLGMARQVYDWIAASWAGKFERKSGAIVEADAKLDAKSERQFVHALITETTIPALDGSSKDPAHLTLKLAPESIKTAKAAGKLPPVSTKQKQFLPSNFRLEIDGLDCSKVTKIDSFMVKQSVTDDGVGERRDFARDPGKLEFPNLRITLAESSAKTWTEWFEDFVVKGKNGDDSEKKGAIVFLDATHQNELGRVTFRNAGIFALRRAPRTDDQLTRLVAELYCEQMELKIRAVPATVQPTPPPVRPVRPARPDVPQPPGP